MAEGNAHRGGFAAALRLMGVGVVEAATTVLFGNQVHGLLELHAARIVVLGKQRWGVAVCVDEVRQGDADFGGFGEVARMLRPELI